MLGQMVPALRMTLLFTVVTGLLYPGVVTGICQVLFKNQANGSLVAVHGRPVGSAILGQKFSKPEYLHPRPSAAGSDGYDASNSSGSNLGPTSQKLVDRVKADVATFRKENPSYSGPVPSDAVTTSASGLDPHISPAFAEAQAARVAAARHTTAEQVLAIVRGHTEGRTLNFIGEPRVNVLAANLALDEHFPVQ